MTSLAVNLEMDVRNWVAGLVQAEGASKSTIDRITRLFKALTKEMQDVNSSAAKFAQIGGDNAKIEALNASLDRQIALFGKTAAEAQRYDAVLAGANTTILSKIDKLQALKKAQEDQNKALASEAEAHRAAQSFKDDGQAFIASLKRKAEALGQSEAMQLRLSAIDKGVLAEAAPIISAYEQQAAALKTMAQAQREASQAAEEVKRKEASAAAAQQARINSNEAFLASIQRKTDALGESEFMQLRMEAIERGELSRAGPLISAYEERAAAIKRMAAAEKQAADEAAKAEMARNKATGFVSGLKERSETQGLSEPDRLRRQASQLPLDPAAKAQVEDYIKSIEAFNATNQKAAAGMMGMSVMSREDRVQKNLLAQANRNLAFQITDVVTSLTSGMPAYMVLIQQGGQIKDSYGGIIPAFKGILNLLTPLRLALGGVGAAAGLVAFGFYQGTQQSKEFNQAMALTGNLAGMTEGKFNGLVGSLNAATKIGAGNVREMLQAIAALGVTSGGTYENIGRASAVLSKLNGKTAAENVAAFASIEDGVVRWAQTANKSYKFLTPEVYKQIAALESQGKTAEAARVASDALAGVLETRLKPPVTVIGRMLEAGKKLWSDWWDAASGNGREETLEDKLKKAQARLDEINNRQLKGKVTLQARGLNGEPIMGAYDAQKSRALSGIDEAKQAAEKLKAEADVSALNTSLGIQRSGKEREAVEARLAQRRLFEESREFYDGKVLLDTAVAERSLLITKNELEDKRKAWDTFYAKGEVSAKAYRAQVLAIDLAGLNAEKLAAEQNLAKQQKRPTETEGQRQQKDADVYAAQTRLLDLQNKQEDRKRDFIFGDPTALRDFNAELAKRNAESNAVLNTQVKLSEADKWAAEQVKKLTENALKFNETERQRLSLEIESQRKKANYAEQVAAMRGWAKQTEDGVRQIREETAALGMGTLARQITTDEIKLQKEAMAELLKPAADEIEVYIQLADAMQKMKGARTDAFNAGRDPTMGAKTAIQSYVENATNGAKNVETMITGSLQRMEDALVDFAKTGKLSFGSLFAFMAEEYLRQFLRMQIASMIDPKKSASTTSLLSMAGSMFSGIGNIAGSIAGFFGFPHKEGLDYVPYDGYPAILHKGERVQTAVQARTNERGGTGSVVDASVNGLSVGAGVSRAEMYAAIRQAQGQQEGRIRRLQREGVMS